MINKFNYAILMFALCFGHAHAEEAANNSKDKKQILAVMQQYTTSIKNKDGKAAAKLFDTASIAYYGSMVERAKYATKQQLFAGSQMDMLTALLTRCMYTPKQLGTATGSHLIEKFVSLGLQKNIPIKFTEDSFDVSKDGKTGYILPVAQIGGIKVAFFNKENGQWKINLASSMKNVSETKVDASLSEDQQLAGLKLVVKAYPDINMLENIWVPAFKK